jgi:acetyl-CoA synthetase
VAGCIEAAAIGIADPLKGQALVLFVVVGPDKGGAARLEDLSDEIDRRLGKPFRPMRFMPSPACLGHATARS